MSLVKTLRAGEADWLRWKSAATREGISLNAWATRSLNRVAELEESLARQEVKDEQSPRRPDQ